MDPGVCLGCGGMESIQGIGLLCHGVWELGSRVWLVLQIVWIKLARVGILKGEESGICGGGRECVPSV